MSSENARRVAKDVLESVGKGEKVVLGKIILKNGYAKKTSLSPKQVTETKTYKEIVIPIVDEMKAERSRIMSELRLKDLSEVDYEKLTKSLDIFTKNIELLSGGDTERTEVKIQIVNADKYDL